MTLLDITTYAGTLAFAITGALKARASKMDIFGAVVLAFVTAYGGGTLRDLLIGVRPVNWINDNIALVFVVGSAGITFLFKLNSSQFRKIMFFTDALGLGLFTVAGIERSLQLGINSEYSLIMGVITATFGGLIADILCNEVPDLLKRGELYATLCAIGGSIYILLKYTALPYRYNILLCVLLIVFSRVYTKKKRISLPGI